MVTFNMLMSTARPPFRYGDVLINRVYMLTNTAFPSVALICAIGKMRRGGKLSKDGGMALMDVS